MSSAPHRGKKRSRAIIPPSPPDSPRGSPEPEDNAPKRAKLEPNVVTTPVVAAPPRKWQEGYKIEKISKNATVNNITTASSGPAPVKQPTIAPPPSTTASAPPANGGSCKSKKSGTARPTTIVRDIRPTTPTANAKTRPVTPTRTPRKRTTSTNNLGSPDDENLPPPPVAPTTPGRGGQRKSLTSAAAAAHTSPRAKDVKSTNVSKVVERYVFH